MYNTLIDTEENTIDTSNTNIDNEIDIENQIETQIETACIICLDIGNEPVQDINLLNSDKYKKRCICNAPVHKSCLLTWYKKSNKCLICHSKIVASNNRPRQQIHDENIQRYRYYNNRRTNKKTIFNLIAILILSIIILYLWIINKDD